jgi:hypothetical protein
MSNVETIAKNTAGTYFFNTQIGFFIKRIIKLLSP